jgi:hypothetical protein
MTWLDDLILAAHSRIDTRASKAYHRRGVSDNQIEAFRLGFLDGDFAGVDVPNEFLSWARKGGKIEDTFVLPLTNILGENKGLQFRHLDKSRKGYQTWLPDSGDMIFFGLGQAAPSVYCTGKAFVVEGAFDLFPVQKSVPWVFATITAGISTKAIRSLKRLASTLWIGYDSDATGRSSGEKISRKHATDFEVKILKWPVVQKPSDGVVVKDPGELWECWGDAKLQDFLQNNVIGAF